MKKQPPAKVDQPGVSKVASISGTSKEDVQALMAQIADLKSQLEVSETKRTDAEKAALAAAESQGMLMQRDIQEVLTGRTVEMRVFSHYKETGSYKDNGDPIVKPVFVKKDIPTYFYKVDMPPVGGMDLKLNGQSFYHGTVYEFDIDTLRTVKEMIYRLWDHDRSIHGSDENAYRTPEERRLSARG